MSMKKKLKVLRLENKLGMGEDRGDSVSVVREYDRTEEKPSEMVHRALADIKNTTPESLDIRLKDYTNVDTLNNFVSEGTSQFDLTVEIIVDGYLVTVSENKVVVSIDLD